MEFNNPCFPLRLIQIPIAREPSKSITNPGLAIPIRVFGAILHGRGKSDRRDGGCADCVWKFAHWDLSGKPGAEIRVVIGPLLESEEPMCSRDVHGALRSIVKLDVQGRVAVFYAINRVAHVDKNGDLVGML